jgi:predicted esterase
MSDEQFSFRKSANVDRVTDKRKDSLFRLVDTDGSGSIDAQEFAVLYDAIKKDLAEELEKEAALEKEASSARRRFKMLLLFVAVLVSFLAASVAANFAVIFTVVDEAITTTTTSSGLLEVKGSDMVAKTAVATQDVPLVVAPALDIETLSNVKTLKVSYHDNANVVEAQLTVVAVRKHNATFVEFVTDAAGETVEILNGISSLVRYPSLASNIRKPPTKFNLCAANATCSAFRASGIDVDAAMDRARAGLEAIGFHDAARQLEERALSTSSGDCSATSSWDYYWCTANCGQTDILDYYFIYHSPATGSVRHVVFFLHGSGGNGNSMWDVYCTAGSWTCTPLQIAAYDELTFVFPTSNIYYATVRTWQSDTLDGSSYSDGDNAIFGLYNNDPAGLITPPDMQNPSAAFSEVMIFGFSSGGGLAVYSNLLHAGLVTWATSIDFTPYHNWPMTTDWIVGFLSGTPSSGYATNIYYSCGSDWYWLEQTTYGASTYSAETGLAPASVHSTGYTYNSVDYETWTWTDATNGNFLKLRIAGLDASLMSTNGVTSPPDTCTCSGTGPSTYPTLILGCNVNSQTCTTGGTDYCDEPNAPSHSAMLNSVDLIKEIDDWIAYAPVITPAPTSGWAGKPWTCHDMDKEYCCPVGTTCRYPIGSYSILETKGPQRSLAASTAKKYCFPPKGPKQMPVKSNKMFSGFSEQFSLCAQDKFYREDAAQMYHSASKMVVPETKKWEMELQFDRKANRGDVREGAPKKLGAREAPRKK